MYIELHPPFPAQVLALFAPLAASQPMCAAVLEGVYPGKLYVDHTPDLQAAALFTTLADGSAWAFGVGQPSDLAFPQAIHDTLWMHQSIPASSSTIFFTCLPEDWHGLLPSVFHPRQPVPMRRRHYIGERLCFDWRACLPEGFELVPLEKGLLERPGLEVPEEVAQCLARWRAYPEMKDFGFALLAGECVAGWVTIDFISQAGGDIGFFVCEPFRRRGLATLLAAAALEHAFCTGLPRVCWTCSDDNPASYKIAEKLGLRRAPDYTSFILALDEAQHLFMLGYAYLLEGHYPQAIEIYGQYLAVCESPHALAYADLAAAWEALGDGQKAEEYRRRAG